MTGLRRYLLLLFAAGISILTLNNCNQSNEVKLNIANTVNILSKNRLELTKEYSLIHYGEDYSVRHDPQAIVLHYTVVPDLEGTLETFLPDTMARSRTDLINNSYLNVGVHFVVDKDGLITRLLPDSIMGRHAIGFNHVSVGIENVAADETMLTTEQVLANVEIVAWLVQEYPSISYLFGHHEYNDVNSPHHSLKVELDSSYTLGPRNDPGMEFMREIRTELKSKYAIVLQN